MLDSCRERLEAGIEEEGTPPDAVAAAIEHALFDDSPKEHYLVVPRQMEAGWTVAKVIEELLMINARHEHSYTRDELVAFVDSYWPFAEGEKSFDNEEDDAEFEVFFNAWAARER